MVTKKEIFTHYEDFLLKEHFEIDHIDANRPWGGFFAISEGSAEAFTRKYFHNSVAEKLIANTKISPKILIVEPQKRLSWQYHFRRSEIWRIVEGPVKIATSKMDSEVEPELYQTGEILMLETGERHRLIGNENNFGVVAEIWIHNFPNQLSDEEDIIRLQDDFGR